ncbi:hypothetical protein GRI40_13575 [Altererythrobacter aerius]|uniref:Short chain dehydrogenase-like proteobacteria domain-containing protein n=1 Tax=Tsuneonella aeria TaxID=1837929 RepID=A0A6I4TG02_9SPHN|nr:hypothetical protein [Tsuneonella aeria]MXO76242.1 hypothetical protein [Tsuneonella aeria]
MQAELRVDMLPGPAIEAAAAFHGEWAGKALAMLSGKCAALAIVLPPAAGDHGDWRLAAARDLARRAAPCRVNLVAGDDAASIAAVLDYLACAPGVTGQYLRVAQT